MSIEDWKDVVSTTATISTVINFLTGIQVSLSHCLSNHWLTPGLGCPRHCKERNHWRCFWLTVRGWSSELRSVAEIRVFHRRHPHDGCELHWHSLAKQLCALLLQLCHIQTGDSKTNCIRIGILRHTLLVCWLCKSIKVQFFLEDVSVTFL